MRLKKPSILYWVVTALAFLVVSATASYSQEGLSTRERKRNRLPVERLLKKLEDPKREVVMQPERVLDIFKVRAGETIADLGAGSGFFSFRLASRVGPKGKVYAVEIEDELLDYIGGKMTKEKVANISLVKSTETGPNLPPGSCDKILVAGCYYYFPDPVGFMRDVRKALKAGGVVAVIDLEKEKVLAAASKSKTGKQKDYIFKVKAKSTVIDEMKKAGFALRESHDFLERRFFLIFSAADAAQSEGP